MHSLWPPSFARIRIARAAGFAPGVTLIAALAAAGILCPPIAGAASPPVQLVESVPVESGLGNPALPSAHDVWIEMIGAAKSRLDLEEFYLSAWPGEPLDDVLAAIRQAAARGVHVRLLLDASMHATYPQPADSLGLLPGIEVRTLDMRKIAGGVQHSKYFIVDGRDVYLGSQNLDWRSLAHIHELGVRVRDARAADAFADVFAMDWEAAAGQSSGRDSSAASARTTAARAPHRPYPISIVQAPGDTVQLWPSFSPRGFLPDSTLWDRDRIVHLLDSARGEIVLQTMTYSPESRHERDDALDAALRRAAQRGVHVRLVISDWEASGAAIQSLQSLTSVPNISVKLSTVPQWSGGYIPFARVEHCKYAVVDSLWIWVGTSNWEPGYFHGTRNVAATLRNRPLALAARRVFETSWTAPGAAPITADSVYVSKQRGMKPPPGQRVYGR